jgi:trans-2,3-dihydro-3-hydroxyanthranilate isomerase
MAIDYYVADVFTNKLFSGAQIAVFPHADELTVEQMQKIANEMNLSETVFLSNPAGGKTSRRMRVFSPLAEIDFAGHPIIATGFVLASIGDVDVDGDLATLTLEQNAGDIEVNISLTDGQPSFIQFNSKVSSIIDRYTPSIEELAEFLSLKPDEIDIKKFSTRLVSCGFPYLIVPVWNYESVRKAKFNFASWAQSAAPHTAAQEILLFSPKTPFRDANFNLRLLGPNIGVNDDPPVGSAMPAFTSYLASFDFTQKGTHAFAVDRGDDKNRRSVLNIEMDHKGKAELGLRIGGEAVLVAEGKMHLPS